MELYINSVSAAVINKRRKNRLPKKITNSE